MAESIVRHSRSAPVNLTGDTELDEAAAILAISDLAICNDMGLAHLAPALGTPTIVIFGPTDPTNTSPFSADADVIRKKVACAPCLHRTCPIDHRCMTGITTDEVFRAAAAKMNEIEEPEPVETAGYIHRP